MIGAIIGLIILVIFLGVVWYCIQLLLPLIPMSEPFSTILRVLVILLIAAIVLWVIVLLLRYAGINVPMFGSNGINPRRSDLSWLWAVALWR